jgi:hypothetical protein
MWVVEIVSLASYSEICQDDSNSAKRWGPEIEAELEEISCESQLIGGESRKYLNTCVEYRNMKISKINRYTEL